MDGCSRPCWSAKWMKKLILTGPPCYLRPDALPTWKGSVCGGSAFLCWVKWTSMKMVESQIHTLLVHRLFAALWCSTWWILSLMGPLACRKSPATYGSQLKWFTAINRGQITSELVLAWYGPVQVQTGAFDFSPHFLPCLNVTTLWEDLMLLLTLLAS